MDPDIALANIAAGIVSQDTAKVRESCQALRGWLQKGGFAPDWSRHPQAARHFGRNYLNARERKLWGVSR